MTIVIDGAALALLGLLVSFVVGIAGGELAHRIYCRRNEP